MDADGSRIRRTNFGWTRSNEHTSTVCADGDVGEFTDALVGLAASGLRRMFQPDRGTFAFTLRRTADGGTELAGESTRYGAIALLGLGRLGETAQRSILGGETATAFCGHLINGIRSNTDIGDVALLTWAAAELSHPDLDKLLSYLDSIDGGHHCETAPAAWVVSALTAANAHIDTADTVRIAAERLMGAARSSNVFAHHTSPTAGSTIRRHVACFADQVYPVQALARFAESFGGSAELSAASDTAAHICNVMGDDGQWWWHYDTRTGTVVEGYPVYSVHQDSMAPMALFDLADAGGTLHVDAIRSGLNWLDQSPEIDGSLVDQEAGIIWRKVGRRDPAKMVRGARALVTRIRPGSQPTVFDRVLRPGSVDWESRPYHLGWILHTWIRKN